MIYEDRAVRVKGLGGGDGGEPAKCDASKFSADDQPCLFRGPLRQHPFGYPSFNILPGFIVYAILLQQSGKSNAWTFFSACQSIGLNLEAMKQPQQQAHVYGSLEKDIRRTGNERPPFRRSVRRHDKERPADFVNQPYHGGSNSSLCRFSTQRTVASDDQHVMSLHRLPQARLRGLPRHDD